MTDMVYVRMYVDDISRHLALHIQLQKEWEGVNIARPFLQFSSSVSRKECVYFCHDQRGQNYTTATEYRIDLGNVSRRGCEISPGAHVVANWMHGGEGEVR